MPSLIGNKPNQVPTNGDLGTLAFQDAANIAGPVGIGGALTLNAGTANGVTYLNGSKVLTSGSGFAYNPSTSQNTLYVEGVNSTVVLNAIGSVYPGIHLRTAGTYQGGVTNNGSYLQLDGVNGNIFSVNNSEQMRLTSTGLGIGTSSPGQKLTVNGHVSVLGGNKLYLWDSTNTATPYLTSNAADVIGFFSSGNTERMRLDASGNLIYAAPATPPTLATNGQMVFNLTSNTNLRVSVRGSDGVTRTANITLA